MFQIVLFEPDEKGMPAFMASPWFQSLLMLLTVLVIGIIISLISSLIMKSSSQESEQIISSQS